MHGFSEELEFSISCAEYIYIIYIYIYIANTRTYVHPKTYMYSNNACAHLLTKMHAYPHFQTHNREVGLARRRANKTTTITQRIMNTWRSGFIYFCCCTITLVQESRVEKCRIVNFHLLLRSNCLRSDSIIDLHEHFQHDQPSVTNYSAPPEASYPQGSYSDGYSGAYSGAYSGGGKWVCDCVRMIVCLCVCAWAVCCLCSFASIYYSHIFLSLYHLV